MLHEPNLRPAIGHGPGPSAVQALVLYLGVPLAIALLYALLRAGIAALLPFREGLLVWTLLILPAWWGVQAASVVLHRVLRPWAPPLWAICVLASIAQAVLLGPYYRAVHAWAYSLTGGVQLPGEWPLPEFSLAYATALAWSIAPGTLIWIATNYFYDRVLGVPRFRYAQPAAVGGDATGPGPSSVGSTSPQSTPPAVTPPALPEDPITAGGAGDAIAAPPPVLARSRLAAARVVHAVTAEEHYVRLYTDAGTDLVRYRFSDVLDELAAVPAGQQVHRSWWVRMDRVVGWHDRGRSCELELDGGLRVPVSLQFRAAVLARLPAGVRHSPGRRSHA